jgi:penicillin-binding protein 1C
MTATSDISDLRFAICDLGPSTEQGVALGGAQIGSRQPDKIGNRQSPIANRVRRRLARALKAAAKWAAIVLLAGAAAFCVCWWAFPFPKDKLRLPIGSRVMDRDGNVLLELVAQDGQWRQPVKLAGISPWVAKATLAVEDRHFYDHHGVDIAAIARAAGQDIRAGKTISGASTITMQLCRMVEPRPRSPWSKCVQAFRALQLERLAAKDEILELYLSDAPYGGNIRGVEAASRIYFGKSAGKLSLAEAALLAGLPQSPGRYRPDRFPDAALKRREMVLRRMAQEGAIDHEQLSAALAEPLNLARPAPPEMARQACWLALHRRPAGGRTTIDSRIQRQVEALCRDYLSRLTGQAGAREGPVSLPRVANLSAVVIDIKTGCIVALVGSATRSGEGSQVDGATAWRSPGSALKPFIYAAAFDARRLAPQSTVYDVPITLAGWSPQDFDRQFRGPVRADDALRYSYNVPAILLARQVGLARCVGLMRAAGVAWRDNPEARGELALAVGAVETNLLDLTNAYATLGRMGVNLGARLFEDEPAVPRPALEPNVCAAINDILSTSHRCPEGLEGLAPEKIPWFMWKTGTSSARRDAWALGHNMRYAVGIWVGRFEGPGCVDFVGAQAAGPLLAKIFFLPDLASDARPPQPQPWAVTAPLPPPPELGGELKITSPSCGSVFNAIGGSCVIHPQINRPPAGGSLCWFLNGRVLGEPCDRLVLAPGRYELRCVDDAGCASAVGFEVR